MDPAPIITLLTDFGTRDAYVAAMKGVILSINPQIQLVDISHDVPPQDIIEAAWLLRTAYRYFPAGTVHLVVVDPVRLDIPEPLVTPGQIRAHVAHIDRFGNLMTNVDVSLLDAFAPDRRALAIQIAGHRITGIATTYSDASPGELLALIESTGLLEIAVREASAAALLQARRGAEVLIEKR